jgi:hypothetical protein
MPPPLNVPPQLRSIIQTEGKARDLDTCMNNIETAKKNELKAYLSLCDLRLQTIP